MAAHRTENLQGSVLVLPVFSTNLLQKIGTGRRLRNWIRKKGIDDFLINMFATGAHAAANFDEGVEDDATQQEISMQRNGSKLQV
ncbi:uncharacterized protein M6D78_006496 isoform 2-T2 [Vipera latastei]